jgi:uncharacterized protein (DUF952 family)
MNLIYKLLDRPAWTKAEAEGAFEGSDVDRADGYIHFSAAAQLQETARLHFRGATGLVLLALDAEALGSAVKWEPSRGGALFPHLYGALPTHAVRWARDVALDGEGVPIIGPLEP